MFNLAGIQFRDFVVLKLYVGTNFHENGQKSLKSRNLIPAKFNTFKVNGVMCFVIYATTQINFCPAVTIYPSMYDNLPSNQLMMTINMPM